MAPSRPDAQRSSIQKSTPVLSGAVSLGGREVLATRIEDGLIVRTDGYRVAAIRQAVHHAPSRSLACSRDARSADERAEDVKLLATGFGLAQCGLMFGQTNRGESDSGGTASTFERIADNEGVASVIANGSLVRIPVKTDDDLLTRVRLLASRTRVVSCCWQKAPARSRYISLAWRGVHV